MKITKQELELELDRLVEYCGRPMTKLLIKEIKRARKKENKYHNALEEVDAYLEDHGYLPNSAVRSTIQKVLK
jgi:predicted translin family RNA/ssDNA-binding protein